MQSFPVVYSSLSTSALQKFVTQQYELPGDSTILFLKRGFNDTYLIAEEKKKYILRVYNHQWRNLQTIESEVKLLLFLKENGISVSVPLQDVKGHYIHPLAAPEGTRYAVLLSYAEGEQIKKLSPDQSFLLGVSTADIHLLTKDKDVGATARNYDVALQLNHSLKVLQPLLENHPKQFSYLLTLRDSFLNMLKNLTPDEVAVGICHGDLQAENFHVSADNQFTFFDFDFFGTGYLVYDIGVFMWYDHKNKPPAVMNAFLEGYESKRKLSKSEKIIIPWLSTLRAIFQMTMYCELSDGKQLPLWPAQQVADFINKVEKWQNAKT